MTARCGVGRATHAKPHASKAVSRPTYSDPRFAPVASGMPSIAVAPCSFASAVAASISERVTPFERNPTRVKKHVKSQHVVVLGLVPSGQHDRAGADASRIARPGADRAPRRRRPVRIADETDRRIRRLRHLLEQPAVAAVAPAAVPHLALEDVDHAPAALRRGVALEEIAEIVEAVRRDRLIPSVTTSDRCRGAPEPVRSAIGARPRAASGGATPMRARRRTPRVRSERAGRRATSTKPCPPASFEPSRAGLGAAPAFRRRSARAWSRSSRTSTGNSSFTVSGQSASARHLMSSYSQSASIAAMWYSNEPIVLLPSEGTASMNSSVIPSSCSRRRRRVSRSFASHSPTSGSTPAGGTSDNARRSRLVNVPS